MQFKRGIVDHGCDTKNNTGWHRVFTSWQWRTASRMFAQVYETKSTVAWSQNPHYRRNSTPTWRRTTADIQTSERTENSSTSPRVCSFEINSILLISLRRSTKIIFVQTLSHYSVLTRSGYWLYPLSTAEVSVEVAAETQMSMDSHILEDVEESISTRFTTFTDLITLDQIVIEQDSVTHFPSQSWSKMYDESCGRDHHREDSRNSMQLCLNNISFTD